jgi:hypothetical protein
MKEASTGALIGAILSLALSASAWGQALPPAATALEDITGCILEGDVVFIVTGRDATARRYKYAWDGAIDALCNAKGFAIGAPVKVSAARMAAPAAGISSAGTAPTSGAPAASGDFPADAQPLSADGVTRKVAGKTFDTQLRDGTRVRLEYKSNGYLFVNAASGYAGSGPWRAEDGRICSQMKGAAASCNDVREQGQRLFLRRDNGEMIALDPR